jgi:hypothetical protein
MSQSEKAGAQAPAFFLGAAVSSAGYFDKDAVLTLLG